jgi:molecular chaperone HscB
MKDPFFSLGVSPRFDLDLEELRERHRELSLRAHPDRLKNKGVEERRAALSEAISVNEAYRVLRAPATRAEALLLLRGVNEVREGDLKMPPEFLMEVLELREELREAGRAKEKSRVEALLRKAHEAEAAATEELRGLLAPERSGDAEAERRAQLALGALRYFQRFRDEAENYLDEID